MFATITNIFRKRKAYKEMKVGRFQRLKEKDFFECFISAKNNFNGCSVCDYQTQCIRYRKRWNKGY